MKKILMIAMCLALSIGAFAQKKTFDKFLNNFSGSFESNMKWYNNDDKLGTVIDDDKIRANSYLKLNYNFLKHFSANVQLESYEPMRLMNYYPEYEKTNLSTYSISYKTNILDITAGHFYEQFGSGLLLRSFEERQLGLNNAIRGGRIKYTPTNYLKLTALGGQNKIAFNVADSFIWGFDGEVDFSKLFNLGKVRNFSVGVSYVGKKEDWDDDNKAKIKDANRPDVINSFAFRTNLDFGNFYTNLEYTLKGKDVAYGAGSVGGVMSNKTFTGNALLYTIGYTQKGLGFSGTFRRLENMAFFADRNFGAPGKNQYNMLNINYIPALVKQQDYSLANIYVYQAQPILTLDGFDAQAGEIGGQFDLFYNIKKGTLLGGKYGTKLAFNFSYWALLEATFDKKGHTYSSEFFKFGNTLNRDFNIEIRKKWSRNFKSIFTYIHKTIDLGVAHGGPLGVQGDIKADIAVAEATYKMKNRKSIRLELQHLWTKEDKKNWVGATAEFVINRNFAVFATDNYNYGNDDKDNRIHYYNVGGSYTKGMTRIAINYGRQRGGLLCVGGVCRYEQPSKGLTLNISTSF